MAKSNIQWTDETWNPTTGCTRVSSGCDHCYAFQLHDQRHLAYKRGRWPSAPQQYHQPFSRVQLLPDRLGDPFSWKAPRRVFVDSMADLFHEDVPDNYLERVWGVMAATPQHTYQILTKRPERMRQWVANADQTAIKVAGAHAVEGLPWRQRDRIRAKLARIWHWPLPNVWLGTSVEDQAAADARLPYLVLTPGVVRFLSCEPLLGPVDLTPWMRPEEVVLDEADPRHGRWYTALHWVIIGGESGPRARPMALAWARSLVQQCRAAGVAPFVKQLGSVWAHADSQAHRQPHGGDPMQWPVDLAIREYPGADAEAS